MSIPCCLVLLCLVPPVTAVPQRATPGTRIAVDAESHEERAGFQLAEGGGWRGENVGHGLEALVDASGVEVKPLADVERWTLRLSTAGLLPQAPGSASPSRVGPSGERLEITRADHVEWWINGPQGLEQGWTVHARPAGDPLEPLGVLLAIAGDLSLALDPGGRGGTFVDATGAAVLRYSGLAAHDAAGRELEARLAARPHGVVIEVDDRGALYPVTIDPILSAPGLTFVTDEPGDFRSGGNGVGDVNGDGFGDFWVDAAFGAEPTVYYGGTSPDGDPDWTPPGVTFSGDPFLPSDDDVHSVGDVNGDGYGDLTIPGFVDRGMGDIPPAAVIYRGGPGGPGLLWGIAYTTNSGLPPAILFRGIGDVNGDGFDDVLRWYPNTFGFPFYRYRVYHGSAGTPSSSSFDVTSSWAFIPHRIRTSGDANGDGYHDLLLTEPGYGPVFFVGRAFLYYGGASGLSTTIGWQVAGTVSGEGFQGDWAGDVNGDGHDDIVMWSTAYSNPEADEGTVRLYLGSPTGPSTTPDWSIEGDVADADLRYHGPVGDLNGDGLADVVVSRDLQGLPLGEDTLLEAYLGSSATGLESTPAWTRQYGPNVCAECPDARIAVDWAGDVNGDGYSDAFQHSPSYDPAGAQGTGVTWLHDGLSEGLADAPAWSVDGGQVGAGLGTSVATALDLNGDGYSDLVAGASGHDGGEMDEGVVRVYYGTGSGLPAMHDWDYELDQMGASLGSAVSSAGDVNGDGYDDLLVGAKDWDGGEADEGTVLVFHGSPSGLGPTPDWSYELDQAGAALGCAVARAGDVNGDGYGDVVVGASGYDEGEMDEGLALVFLGSATGLSASPDWSYQPDVAGALLGSAVGGAADVDADGFHDLLVGAPGWDDGEAGEGLALAFQGSPGGPSASPDWSFEVDQAGAALGTSVTTAGDVNGDGTSDVIVGAPGHDGSFADEGRALAFHGSPAGLLGTASWMADGGQASAAFGTAVGFAGDADGDGYADVVVGAPGASNGEMDEGVAYLYHGSGSGLAAEPGWSYEADQASATLGSSVAAAGDVEGDGVTDVVVGAAAFDGMGADEGGLFLFGGNGGRGGAIRAPQQLQADGSAPIALHGATGAPESFRIRVELPAPPSGATTAWLEWEIERLGVPFDGQGIHSGTPQSVMGSPLTFDELVVLGTIRDRQIHWRACVVTDDDMSPRTPWFSIPGNAPAESKLLLRGTDRKARLAPPGPPTPVERDVDG